MDCAGLRADIDKLKNELSVLESDVEKIRKTERRNKGLQNAKKLIGSNSADLMLEKYLKDFQERNLDIFPVVTLGERIDIRDAYGGSADVYNITAAGNGHVLIGGDDGVFYAGSYNERGELELGERIDIMNADGDPAYIRAITALDDKRVLIGGSWGVFYAGSYNDQGELEPGERIDIKDIYGYSADINSIAATKDGRVLIGGLMGTLYAGAFDISFETLKQHLPEIIKKGESGER